MPFTESPLTSSEREARITKTRRMSVNQARFVADLVDARFEANDPARETWRSRYREIRTNQDVSAMIEDLKALPTLADRLAEAAAKAAAEREANRPTEAGYYRNPETGELYRLRYAKNGDAMVLKYSKTGGLRRLSTEGNLVKGTWKELGAFRSRMLLTDGKLLKSWFISEQALTEYAYGFCPFHGGPLTDGVSVILGYGETCARKRGLPWGEEYARAVLAAQQEGAAAE